ncbi:uncharacterized mitochondrial protein AtMg00810-like [Capsicum annuum]|uniref:uncharacterized mitochondrial protein AtMg00810-like n=1 Tax=Capsicum annuum TaxID=4072 RepID=UPI001FB19B37|nr:uncharacterized mitochondrial protein AtMg00810-like [Capsicum annuum]
MVDARSFKSLVGGLIYLTHTRPDIAFSVGVIFKFMQQPSKVHFGVSKRVLHYIAGTMDYGIWYSQVSNFRLCGFTDSDYAGSLDAKEQIIVKHCSTHKQLADILTKSLAADKFIYLRALLGVCNFELRGSIED